MAYSKLYAIKEGDHMVTFVGFSCIAGGTIVHVEHDPSGLFFAWSDGKHYLSSQVDESGNCLGLTALI